MTDRFICEANISDAWARAVQRLVKTVGGELVQLTVSAEGDPAGPCSERPAIRKELDRLLTRLSLQGCETVANTIFPASLWNPTTGVDALVERFRSIWPKARRHPKNARGTYFQRMVSWNDEGSVEQLQTVLANYKKVRRRSILQLICFDPARDHTGGRRLGFPCLQSITFSPHDEELSVSASIPLWYLAERGYGNLLGVGRLGQFVAHELDLELVRVTVHAGICQLDQSKQKLAGVVRVADACLGPV